MFGKRKRDQPSGSEFHHADGDQQLFAQLLAETRADPEKVFTIEIVGRGRPGRDLDEQVERLRRSGVTASRPPATEAAADRASGRADASADELVPLSREPFTAETGDVFLIPDGGGRVLLGHVLATLHDAVYVAVFQRPEDLPRPADPLVVLATQPVVAGLTLPARFQPGMWEVVGTVAPDTDRLLPAYTWGTDVDGVHVTDFDGSRSRPATEIEATTVPRRVLVSPYFIDIAVRAVVGLVDWHPDFEHLRYRSTPRSVDLFPAR
ncbi:hypothetical protein DEJ16_12090 [Curtobacterium sp. MCJR17_055]|uniref:hypothetical protein n=1 Tax=unclassified Curtobacterium TaxID=257496 RepID=UPI000D9B5F91|nr:MULTISPECIES: hypothetical protein [unclassified Curtobacterium]PYY33100.1 hypothetical protein DEI87_13105 [Curtobacterium sp. MCBD17_029]PYY53844.1 hypothetical protein DEJ16_12090 [Curtobacterium sp. MCJR17_055]PYY59268.1 hypothetical protein DEJ26_09725 [Curtobacterium sp. MCPF17_015]